MKEIPPLLQKREERQRQQLIQLNQWHVGAFLKEFVQKARYEDFIIGLVSAYEDYVFYLPAFMDFRGRIYRAGILHFHERDLARSLIVFANNHQEDATSRQRT
jgi:DNA-directed RNA polymerase